jgi:cell division protein FtsQ
MATRESKKTVRRPIRWRLWLGVLALLAVCVSGAMAAIRVRNYVRGDPQFALSRERPDALTIEGLRYTPRQRVESAFATDFDRSVLSTPLAERRRRLLAIDWIEDASVARLWPDRLVVRIRERKPVAFVNLRGNVMLIDAQGVLLELPGRTQFYFPVLGGVNEETSESDRKDRVQVLMRVQKELGAQAKDVSEVDASDPSNVRLVAQVSGRGVELIVGDTDFGKRYRTFQSHFAEIDRRFPDAKTFDLRLGDRITVKE